MKKLREKSGLTVVEMLAATIVLTLLALMLGTGLQMALHSYETIIAQSELELLVSTAVDAIADDLRYARNVQGNDGSGFECRTAGPGDANPGVVTRERLRDGEFTYTSDSFYGEGVYLDLGHLTGAEHQIVARTDLTDPANGMRVLSTGSYGSGGVSYKEYWVTYLKITKTTVSGEIFFTIELTAETADRKIIASTPEGGVTVRCLNPAG